MKNNLHFSLIAFLALFVNSAFAQNIEVSGAGSTQANGIYTPGLNINGKAGYEKVGDPAFTIFWDEFQVAWGIYEHGFTQFYASFDDVATPDLATNWMSAFGNTPLPTVTAIQGPSLSYSGNRFTEVVDNNGAIEEQITINYNGFNGDFLTGSINENYVASGKVSVSNVPAGLTAQVVLTAANQLTFSLTGQANLHTAANNISDLTLEFANSAFNANDAVDVFGYLKNDFEISYRTAYTVCASGCDFTSIQTAINTISSGDIINLSAETYTEQNIDINKQIIIKGTGANQTIIQASATTNTATNRVIIVSPRAHLIIKDVTVRHGRVVGGSNTQGAGIWSTFESKLEMYRCVVRDNIVNNNINTSFTAGGGISAFGVAKLIIEDCLVLNNELIKSGASLSIGGGLYLTAVANSEELRISNTTFSGNSITGASSTAEGGGIALEIDGILPQGLLINNCTFTNNTTTGKGGGVAFVNNDNFTNLRNSIIFGNTAAATGADYFRGSSGVVNAFHNIIGVSAAASGNAINGTNTNNSDSDPLLQALADNGGPTKTHAIIAGSPAIDGGDGFGLLSDQRGQIVNGTRDIGAFEFDGLDPATNRGWSGASTGDWNNANNWVPKNIPGATTNAIIKSSANHPTITSAIEIAGLDISAGATLIIEPSNSLVIGVGNLNNNGSIELRAELGNYSQLKFAGTYSGTGTIAQEQYLTGGWHNIAVPVSGNVGMLGDVGADRHPNAQNLRYWDASVGNWMNVADNAEPLTAGRGYNAFVGANGVQTSAGIVTASGTPNSEVAINLSYTDSPNWTGFDDATNNGWNLVANPFCASLDFTSIALSGNVEDAFHIWNPAGNAYVSWANAAPADGVIPPMQSFWVRATDPMGPSLGTLTYANTTVSATPTFRKTESISDHVLLRVSEAAQPENADVLTFALTYDNATDGFDNNWDARKMMNPGATPSLYSLGGGVATSINAIPYGPAEVNSKMIPLGMRVQSPNSTAFSIALDDTYLNNHYDIYLEDSKEKVFHNLKESAYRFVYDADAPYRFKLHFGTQGVAIEEGTAAVSAWVFGNDIYVRSNDYQGPVRWQIIDVNGREVQRGGTTRIAISETHLSPLPDLSSGLYMLQIVTDIGVENIKFRK